MTTDQIIFHPDKLEFKNYSIKVSSVITKPLLPATSIKEIRLQRWPLEIVTNEDEVLFIPAPYARYLDLFARINRIPVVVRVDVWGLINEPYLDQEFSPEREQKNRKQLNETGISDQEIDEIRNKIHDSMDPGAAITWEWVHYSHYDTLVHQGYGANIQFNYRMQARYDEFNRLSNRGKIIETSLEPKLEEKFEQQISNLVNDLFPDPYLLASANDESAAEKSMEITLQRRELNKKLLHLMRANHNKPQRFYHNLFHTISVVENCSMLCQLLEVEQPLSLRLAAWFHDAIYEPTSSTNEKDSADLMKKELTGIVDENTLNTAYALILMTTSHAAAKTDLEKILSDADLATLAEEENIYLGYSHNVRREYSHIDDLLFNQGRLQFLESMLTQISEKKRLFHHLPPLYEKQALTNIVNERNSLKSHM